MPSCLERARPSQLVRNLITGISLVDILQSKRDGLEVRCGDTTVRCLDMIQSLWICHKDQETTQEQLYSLDETFGLHSSSNEVERVTANSIRISSMRSEGLRGRLSNKASNLPFIQSKFHQRKQVLSNVTAPANIFAWSGVSSGVRTRIQLMVLCEGLQSPAYGNMPRSVGLSPLYLLAKERDFVKARTSLQVDSLQLFDSDLIISTGNGLPPYLPRH
eukprot:756005-Hanusia_phi.AAC.2